MKIGRDQAGVRQARLSHRLTNSKRLAYDLAAFGEQLGYLAALSGIQAPKVRRKSAITSSAGRVSARAARCQPMDRRGVRAVRRRGLTIEQISWRPAPGYNGVRRRADGATRKVKAGSSAVLAYQEEWQRVELLEIAAGGLYGNGAGARRTSFSGLMSRRMLPASDYHAAEGGQKQRGWSSCRCRALEEDKGSRRVQGWRYPSNSTSPGQMKPN